MKQKLFWFFLLIGCQSFAVDPFARLLNNLYYGYNDCSGIKRIHLAKLSGKSCTRMSTAYDELAIDSLSILKNLTFEASRKLAENKNECISDYTNAINNSPTSSKEYLQKLAVLYINRKKALLILDECEKIEKALNMSNAGFRAAAVRQREDLSISEIKYLTENNPDLALQYAPLCRNRKQLISLKAAIEVLNIAAPFLSSEKLFQVMEKNRKILVSATTGQSMSDKEIRDANLSGDELIVRINYTNSKGFSADLKQYFDSAKTERSHFLSEISGDFSDRKLQKLFEEGSGREAMDDMGLSKQKAMVNKDIAQMNYCLRSIYEPNLVADIVETVALFALIEAVFPPAILMATSQAGKVAALASSNVGQLGVGSLSMLVANSPAIKHACEKFKAREIKIGGRTNKANEVLAGLPSEFDFQILKLGSLPIHVVESCRELGMDRFFSDRADEISCAVAILLSAIPANLFHLKGVAR